MFLDFKTVDDLPELHENKYRIAPNGMRIPDYNRHDKYDFWSQFFYCQCGHIYYNHNFNTEKCDAYYFGPCDCEKLVFCEAHMEIVFTTADVFEAENPNHSEHDSPQWWVEFGEWYENRSIA